MTRRRAELVSWKMRLRKEWMFDTPEQCRERRRRRIEMRRARWSSSGHRPLPVRGAQHISNGHDQTCLILSDEEDGGPTDHEVAVQPAVPPPRYLLHRNPMPEFRTMSFSRLPDQMSMELNDTVFVKEDFCRLDHVLHGQPIHFFAVYDGHGHPHLQSERWNEQERMRAVDGRMFYHNGVRVYGTLNMSHSPNPIEHIYKPVVTLEPHISIIKREGDQDEFLILANDGLWDVVPDDMACRVACTCLRGGGGGGSSGHMNRATAPNPRNVEHCLCPPNTDGHENARGGVFLSTKSNLAATLLCRLALARGSHGDISVMVVDLKSG